MPAPSADEWSLWQKVALVGVALLVLIVIAIGYVFGTKHSAQRQTTAIILAIRTGIEITLGGRGEMIPLDFAYLREHFGYHDTLAELRALQSIDEARQCFVDAWGRPLVIRALANRYSYEVISSGPDGLPGTSDDLR